MPSPQSPPESPPDPLLAGVFALVPPPSAEPSSRPAAAPPSAAARPPADRPRVEPLPVLTPQGGRGQLSGRAWAGFAVGDLVGAGGMGEVYRARQEDLARIVALKVLPEAAGRDPVLRQRFNAEARAAARLHDANVVAIYDSGECDGRLWLAMEFVPGRGLDQALRERRQEGRPFTPLEAAGLAVQAAHGLAAAHRERLVHRDVKPGNLLLADDGTLKVADFGLVRILDDHTLTTAGSVLGTPLYLSPEQGRGLPAGPASDVYALGVVLYELLTLQPPFTGGSAEELVAQHNFTEPELPSRRNPDIPADLQAICLKCLQKDPARRFPDAGALAADLERVRLGLAPLSAIFPPGALSTGAAEAIRRLAGRRRQWLAAALVLAAVLAGLAAWGWWWDMRKTEVAAVRARLRPLAAVAPIPDTAAADLDRLAALAGGDDPQVAQGRAKLAAVAALAAAVAPDASAAAAQAALAGLREAVGDDGDPRLARWQAERAAAVGARRDLLARFLADPEPAPVARAAAAEALAWLHGHAGAEPVQARQVAERLAALDQEREELARRLAVLDAPRPLPAGIDAALARYERLAGFDDARATAWRTRLAAVHAVQARLAILDRAVPVPPEASGDLDRLIALVGAEDAQAAAWAGKLAAVRELIARLAAARERPQPVPAWIAGDLDRLATLVGGDPEITAWRQRIAAIAAVRGRLAALDQAAPPPAEAAADLARLAALVGDEDAQVRAGTAKLAALRELGGRLGAALARAEPEPAWVAADLARLAGLAGDGDALIAAWRARRAETARLHAALGDLARRIALDAAAVVDADRLLAEARRLVGEDAAVRAAAVRLAALRAPPRPAWAVAAGQDRHGPWAEFALGPVVQRLRWLPPLAYRIGSAADEAGHEDDEAVATVTIARGLWVAERECSQALYAAVLGAWPAERRDPDRPVEQVSRADAERCCARLSALLPGAVVRLPGEAEWEAAVRGGAAGPWAGLDEAQAVAAVAHHGSRLDAPLPVGSGPANAFGIQDGPGNVREWCRGAYGPPLAGAHLDPLPTPGRLGVVRGGSWADPLLKCRPANRAPLDPGARSPALGFRLVIEP